MNSQTRAQPVGPRLRVMIVFAGYVRLIEVQGQFRIYFGCWSIGILGKKYHQGRWCFDKEVMMDEAIAKRWIVDLRANPKQVKGALSLDGGHCCLGRLCLVLGYEFKDDAIRWTDEDGYIHRETGVLPPFVQDIAKMQSAEGAFVDGTVDDDGGEYELTNLNDSGKTFAEIADIIEKHWRKL
jgi:hypothetical protein